MNRHFEALLFGLLATFTLSGCATPTVAGNEIGGAIPMAGLTRQQAADLARAHCAKYGRSSRILAIRSETGEKVTGEKAAGEKAIFECI